jgi:hypothetical protein
LLCLFLFFRFRDDLVTPLHAFVAYIHSGASDKLMDLLLVLAAEGTPVRVPGLPEIQQ